MSYKTHQRDLILSLLEDKKDYSLSCKDILSLLNGSVSKATLYRYLDLLEEEKLIKKFYNELTSNYEFQYIKDNCMCNSHLHLKCIRCGKLIHLNCNSASDFLSHIAKEHDFYIDEGTTVIYGLCSDCSLIKR